MGGGGSRRLESRVEKAFFRVMERWDGGEGRFAARATTKWLFFEEEEKVMGGRRSRGGEKGAWEEGIMAREENGLAPEEMGLISINLDSEAEE
ncbi:unnamed protein product [Brassica rapa subsp. trilocularis]